MTSDKETNEENVDFASTYQKLNEAEQTATVCETFNTLHFL